MMLLKNNLYSLKGVLALLFFYGFSHSVLRLLASGNLGENDPLSALRTQSFNHLWVSGGAPFDFAVFFLSEIFGPGAFIFQILRYGLLGLSLIFVFLSARHLTKSSFWALLSVEAYALIYQISWRFHEGFTYPLIAMLAVSALFYSFLRIERERSFFNIVLALFFCVFGALTGIWFFAFLLSLVFGLLFVSLKGKRTLLIIISFGLILGFWLLFQASFFENNNVEGQGVFYGASKAGLKILAYFSPLLPILFVIFGISLKNGIEKKVHQYSSWLLYSSLGAAFGMICISAFLKDAPFSEHALMPLFFLTPLWLMDLIRRLRPKEWQIKCFVGLCLVLMMVAFLGRAANLFVLDPVCKRCYFGIPYKVLAEEIKSDLHFQRADNVISPSTRLTGNLYAFWPQKSFLLPHEPLAEATLFIWPETFSNAEITAWFSGKNIPHEQAVKLVNIARPIKIDWSHLWRKTGYRQSVWKAVLIEANY